MVKYMKNLVVLLIILTNLNIFCDENIFYHTNLAVGDTIKVLDNEYKKFRVYSFVNEQNCFTCMQSLTNVCNELHRLEKSSQILTFISTKSNTFLNNFKEEYKWKYEITMDPIEAYKNLYHVKLFPLFLLTDNNGVIFYIGLPGSVNNFEFKDIFLALKKIQEEQKEDLSVKNLEFQKKIYLLDSNGGKISDLKPFWCQKNEISDNYIIPDIINNKIFMFDSNGKSLGSILLKPYGIQYFLLSQGNVQNEEIYLINCDLMKKKYIYKADIRKQKLDTLIYCDESKMIVDNYYPHLPILKLDDSTFFIGQIKYDFKKIQNEPLYKSYTINSDRHLQIGIIDSLFARSNFHNFFSTSITVDNNNNIYTIQNFKEKIDVYNFEGKKLKEIKCHFDTTYYYNNWHEDFNNFNRTTPFYKVTNLRFKLTSPDENNALIYDRKKNKIYVTYHKILDDNNLEYFIHSPQDSEEGKNSTDIALPVNCFPVQIDNGILSVLRKIDGFYCIVQYSSDVWK
jgi:hypothetical protein